MKRKAIGMLLASVLAASAVTACGKEAETAENVNTEDTEEISTQYDSPMEQFGEIEVTEDPNAPQEDKSSLDGLAEDAVDMDENVGDKKHCTFSYNGTLYEFTEDKNTKLYSYKSFMEDTASYPDQGGIIDLVSDVNGKPSRLMGMDSGVFQSKSSLETVYEGENTTIYHEHDGNRNWDYYYAVFDDFVFQIYDYQTLTAAGVKKEGP